MSTRVYFDSTYIVSITPSFGSDWTRTSDADRRRANRFNQGSIFIDKEGILTNASGVGFVLARQYILEGLSAQILSGTFKGQIACLESSGGLNATLAVVLAKCDFDGANRVDIVNVVASDSVITPPEMTNITVTNRRMLDVNENTPITIPLTPLNFNDALLIEIGYREDNVTASRNARFRFGETSISDLPEDDTTTANNNPWIEFSQDLIFGEQIPFRTTVTGKRFR